MWIIFSHKLIELVPKLAMALWSKHLWPGGLKKIDIQLIIFKLIVRNSCSSVCVHACVRTHVHVYVCVCVCVGCISAEFYYSIPTGNMSFTLWLFAFLYMILPSVSFWICSAGLLWCFFSAAGGMSFGKVLCLL